MSQSVQCQAHLGPQRQCTNNTLTPDALCHRHKGWTGSNSGPSAGSIPRLDGLPQPVAMADQPDPIMRFINTVLENRRLRKNIMDALPAKRVPYFRADLRRIHDTEHLRGIRDIVETLYADGTNPHDNIMSVMFNLTNSDKASVMDVASAKEYLLTERQYGMHDAFSLRSALVEERVEKPNKDGSIPNFAEHLKVSNHIRTMEDSYFTYFNRDGLAMTVSEHPDKTNEIIDYVDTHPYSPLRYSRDKKPYDAIELQQLFVHSALGDGVL